MPNAPPDGFRAQTADHRVWSPARQARPDKSPTPTRVKKAGSEVGYLDGQGRTFSASARTGRRVVDALKVSRHIVPADSASLALCGSATGARRASCSAASRRSMARAAFEAQLRHARRHGRVSARRGRPAPLAQTFRPPAEPVPAFRLRVRIPLGGALSDRTARTHGRRLCPCDVGRGMEFGQSHYVSPSLATEHQYGLPVSVNGAQRKLRRSSSRVSSIARRRAAASCG